MPPDSSSPLALIGHGAPAARALRELGIIAVNVPSDDLRAVLDACRTLRFAGALVHPSQEVHALDAATPDGVAQRAGRIDAISFAGGVHGTFALADALSDTLAASGYSARGASAVLIGADAHDLALALPLTRLGFSDLGLVADSLPEAERAARAVPAGVRAYPMSRRDPALSHLTERADLLVLTAGTLPRSLAQPYHTLMDLTGQATLGNVGSLLDLSALPTHRLSRQLAHATGERLRPEELGALARALA